MVSSTAFSLELILDLHKDEESGRTTEVKLNGRPQGLVGDGTPTFSRAEDGSHVGLDRPWWKFDRLGCGERFVNCDRDIS